VLASVLNPRGWFEGKHDEVHVGGKQTWLLTDVAAMKATHAPVECI